jgi:hypothetical protein
MKLTNAKLIGICVIMSASILTASSSQAETQSLNACVKKSNGVTRIISGKMKCARSERKVTWTSTSDGLVGPAGSHGSTGAVGPAGSIGLTGEQGDAGTNGTNGTDGVDGVNGLSKVLVASGNQVSINQGSEGVILSATVPAGKYAMDLSASLSYSNGFTSMSGQAFFTCYLTSQSSYSSAAGDTLSIYWPEEQNGSPYRLNFELTSAYDGELMRRSFANSSTLTLTTETNLNWICRHYSEITDDSNEKVFIRYPRIVLTAVDEIVSLN